MTTTTGTTTKKRSRLDRAAMRVVMVLIVTVAVASVAIVCDFVRGDEDARAIVWLAAVGGALLVPAEDARRWLDWDEGDST